MDNRQQRRAAMRKGKRPGETFADVLNKKKMIEEAVRESVHDHSIAIEADIKTQRFLWMAVIALNEAFGFGGERAKRFLEALTEGRADAALAASLFHYKELEISDLKSYLAEQGVSVRK